LLAYGIDDRSSALRGALADRVELRAERARRIVHRLADHGITVPWDLIACQTTGAIGRPHIARALVQQGHADSVTEAFVRWIGLDAPGYVPAPPFSASEAVKLARDAGGEVALAHPLRGKRRPPLATAIPSLIAAGVTGLEVYYSEHSAADASMLRAVAGQNRLWWCGGSDFHGANKPQIDIGCADVPPGVLQQGPFQAVAGGMS
jgi:hypothetical protein